jgi:hypothetical protein
MRGVLVTTLCDTVCQRLATSRWFSPGTPVSDTNKSDHCFVRIGGIIYHHGLNKLPFHYQIFKRMYL